MAQSVQLKNAVQGIVSLANAFQGGSWSLLQALRGDNDSAYLIFEWEGFDGTSRYLHVNLAMSDTLGSSEFNPEPETKAETPEEKGSNPYV